MLNTADEVKQPEEMSERKESSIVFVKLKIIQNHC